MVTAPLTTASPRPHAAASTISSRAPVVGFAVNMTPAASASTISWTTTASATSAGSIPRRARYATARDVHSDAQQSRTAVSSASSPRTSRNVSCWPAKLASSRSSAVADDRTATAGPSSVRAVRSSAAISSGTGAVNRARTSSALPSDAAATISSPMPLAAT